MPLSRCRQGSTTPCAELDSATKTLGASQGSVTSELGGLGTLDLLGLSLPISTMGIHVPVSQLIRRRNIEGRRHSRASYCNPGAPICH